MLPSPKHVQLCHVLASPTTTPSRLSSNDWIEIRADDWPDPNQAVSAEINGSNQRIFNLGNDFVKKQASFWEPLLRLASCRFDLINIPLQAFSSDIAQEIPAFQRLISWNGSAANIEELLTIFGELSTIPGRYYQVVIQPRSLAEALLPLQLLHHLKRTDVIAYAAGPSYRWTQILALWLGSPFLFALSAGNTAQHYTLPQLSTDYGWPNLPAVNQLFGVVGQNLCGDISIRLHNHGYHHSKLNAIYVPFEINCFQEFNKSFIQSQTLSEIGFPIEGISIRAPFREEAASETHLQVSPFVLMHQTANLWLPGPKGWFADSIDHFGIQQLFKDNPMILGQGQAAVWGCGKAAQCMAIELQKRGAHVSLVVRNLATATQKAGHLGLPFLSKAQFSPRNFSLIVNATPVGSKAGEILFNPEGLNSGIMVVDLCFGAANSELVAHCRRYGLQVIDGRKILALQTQEHFRRMTGSNLGIGLFQRLTAMHQAESAIG